jgi:hypothetical protein
MDKEFDNLTELEKHYYYLGMSIVEIKQLNVPVRIQNYSGMKITDQAKAVFNDFVQDCQNGRAK